MPFAFTGKSTGGGARPAWLRFLMVLCLLVPLLEGCTTEPLEPQQQVEKAIVLPLFTLHKELRSDLSIVQTQLVRALEAAGYECEQISEEEFEKLRDNAFSESGSIYNPSVGEYVALEPVAYRKSLLQQLRSRGFDVMILPELQLRAASVQGNSILWDGVSRDVIVRGSGRFLMPREARGLSLAVTAYGSTGVLVGRGFGGITVPFYLDTTGSTAQFRLRDAFYDSAEVKEGVAIAIRGLRRH
jgi:hypothetical protein